MPVPILYVKVVERNGSNERSITEVEFPISDDQTFQDVLHQIHPTGVPSQCRVTADWCSSMAFLGGLSVSNVDAIVKDRFVSDRANFLRINVPTHFRCSLN
jgi:hypothetical protein